MSKDEPLAAPPSVLLAEEHLRVLAELREIGMEMTRILKRRAEIDLQSAETLAGHAKSIDAYLQPPPLPGPMRDPATAFARMSRAVRLTLALEARTAEALRALRAGLPLPLEKSQRETSQAQAGERIEAAKTAGRPEVSGELDDSPEEDVKDGDEFEAADVALRERLGDHEAGEHLAGRPLGEVVESLRADLRLAPDWSRWAGKDFAMPGRTPEELTARLTVLSKSLCGGAASTPWAKIPPPATPPPSADPPSRGRTAPG